MPFDTPSEWCATEIGADESCCSLLLPLPVASLPVESLPLPVLLLLALGSLDVPLPEPVLDPPPDFEPELTFDCVMPPPPPPPLPPPPPPIRAGRTAPTCSSA